MKETDVDSRCKRCFAMNPTTDDCEETETGEHVIEAYAGKGRGNWGHAGRPGHEGGSAPSQIGATHLRAGHVIHDWKTGKPAFHVTGAGRTGGGGGYVRVQGKAAPGFEKKYPNGEMYLHHTDPVNVSGTPGGDPGEIAGLEKKSISGRDYFKVGNTLGRVSGPYRPGGVWSADTWTTGPDFEKAWAEGKIHPTQRGVDPGLNAIADAMSWGTSGGIDTRLTKGGVNNLGYQFKGKKAAMDALMLHLRSKGKKK